MVVSRLREIPGIGVDRMGDAADAANDPAILRLENLDTDLRPPASALAATRAAIEADAANSYLPFRGTDGLRQAAARHVGRMAGQSYGWRSECVIAAGGLNGILNALLALLEPGDEVLMTDPIYAGLVNRVKLAGGVPRYVPLVPTPAGWRLDLDALRAAASPKMRVVLMMSPSMPTGSVLTRAEWDAVADLCRKTDAWLLYDAAMERILYDGVPHIHPASLEGMRERTLTVGSVAKEQRMIGWRIGWVVGPERAIADIGLVGLTNVVCQVGIGMPGAQAALEAPEEDVAEAVAEWGRRRDTLLAELDGLPVIRPNGGWSMLLDVSPFGMDGAAASKAMLAQAKIAATAMAGWGSAASARYLRFVFANEPVERLRGMGARVRRALGC